MAEDLFNVVVFNAEGYWHYALRDVPARQAVDKAHALASADEQDIDRVMITDADDFANFLWERGKGIVYPTENEGLSRDVIEANKPC